MFIEAVYSHNLIWRQILTVQVLILVAKYTVSEGTMKPILFIEIFQVRGSFIEGEFYWGRRGQNSADERNLNSCRDNAYLDFAQRLSMPGKGFGKPAISLMHVPNSIYTHESEKQYLSIGCKQPIGVWAWGSRKQITP